MTKHWFLFFVITFIIAGTSFSQKKDEKFSKVFDRLTSTYVKGKNKLPVTWLYISAATQKMFLLKNNSVIKTYDISTAYTGTDSNATEGTNKTPLGFLRVSKCIGEKAKTGTIFKFQKSTGRIADIIYDKKKLPPKMEDLITSRVLVLSGLEKGLNAGHNKKGQNVDSGLRGIYIHGTNNEANIGEPASHGCIRMRNKEIIELFDLVDVGTILYISLK